MSGFITKMIAPIYRGDLSRMEMVTAVEHRAAEVERHLFLITSNISLALGTTDAKEAYMYVKAARDVLERLERWNRS